jgi:flavin reductase (DIM6/NTAB) family NADH-FMN oxidoreductase RutF
LRFPEAWIILVHEFSYINLWLAYFSMNAPDPPAPRPPHPTAGAPPVTDTRHFRDCLGVFATGVTIVTTRAPDGGFIGLTANSFNALSLDPALVLWSLGRGSASLDAFISAEHFAVSVLATDQMDLARRFAKPFPDRFAGVGVHRGLGGAPLIEGALAWFECHTRVHYEQGDHVLFIGEVKHCARIHGSPLLFRQGEYASSLSLPGGQGDSRLVTD